MKGWQVASLLLGFVLPVFVAANPSSNENGIVDIRSNHSVDETVARIKTILQSKGITLFALIDHSGEAQRAGLTMPPTKLLIFGSPKAGTALMLASPRIAIDLPLKILVWQNSQGQVWVSYNNPDYLRQRYDLPESLLPTLRAVGGLATQAAQ